MTASCCGSGSGSRRRGAQERGPAPVEPSAGCLHARLDRRHLLAVLVRETGAGGDEPPEAGVDVEAPGTVADVVALEVAHEPDVREPQLGAAADARRDVE